MLENPLVQTPNKAEQWEARYKPKKKKGDRKGREGSNEGMGGSGPRVSRAEMKSIKPTEAFDMM